MAKFSDHCLVDRRHLRKEFPEVHHWLDEFALRMGNAHRRCRHHVEGIEEVRARWGDEAAKAARLHVLVDMGHMPVQADWNAGGVTRPDGEFVPMDAMGILEDAIHALPSGLVVAAGTGWSTHLYCSGCMRETIQFLNDVAAGLFVCVSCRERNEWSDYRIGLG